MSDFRGQWMAWGTCVLVVAAISFLLAPTALGGQPPNCGLGGQRGCCLGESPIISSGCYQAFNNAQCQANGFSCPSYEAEVAPCSLGAACECSSSECITVTNCGGNGQRACCSGDFERPQACAAGLFEVSSGTVPFSGSGLCGGINFAQVSSNTTCVIDSACGAPGQRACCPGEPERPVAGASACPFGGVEVSGCEGDALGLRLLDRSAFKQPLRSTNRLRRSGAACVLSR